MGQTTVTINVLAAASVPSSGAPTINGVETAPGFEWTDGKIYDGEKVPVAPAPPAHGTYTFPCEGAYAVVFGFTVGIGSCEYQVEVGFDNNCNATVKVTGGKGCEYNLIGTVGAENEVTLQYEP